ncbi:MAG: hypothetical protein IPQ13_11285 [Holophagaceae bacterium]|nr:hypothetical protein [Holophagaceae bacterium]
MSFLAPKRLSVATLSWVLIGSLMAAGPASLLSNAQAEEQVSAAPQKEKAPPPKALRKMVREEQEREGLDRPDLRRDANLMWFGGAPSPAELDARNALAAQEVARWAHQIPGAPLGPHALPLPPNSVSWTNIGPFTQNSNGGYGTDNVDVDSGRPMAVLTHPTNAQIIYLATSGGGIFKCTNADHTLGATAWVWTAVTDGLPATSTTGNVSAGALGMGIADGTGNTIYAGMGDSFDAEGRGFYKSTNGGGSWTAATGIGSQTRSHAILVLPQAAYPGATGDVIYWATNNGLKRSVDGGATFTNAATVGSGDAWSVAAFGSSTQNLVCSIQGGPGTGIYYSSNAGQTWTLAGITGASPAARITLATTAASATKGYGIYEDGSGNIAKGVLHSEDSGHNWAWQAGTNLFTVSGDGGQGFYNHMVTVDPANANTVFMAANLAMYRSTDSGANWTQLTHWYGGNAGSERPFAHADFHGAFWSKTGTPTLFVVNDGGLTILRDPFRASVPTVSLDTTFVDTRRNYGLSTHLIYNIGSTISTAHADDKYRVIAGLQDNGTRVRVGSGPGLNTSGIFDEPIGGDGFGCNVNATDGNLMMGTLYYAHVQRSTNGGLSFTTTDNQNDTGVFYSKVAPGRADATGNTMYTFTSSTVRRTTNYGATAWSALSTSPGTGIRNINTATTDPLVLGVTRNAGAVDITTDGGSTWTHYTSGNFPNNLVNTFNYIWFDTTNASTVYVASAGAGITSNHLWKKVGAGAWTAIDAGGFPTGIPIHVIQNDPLNGNTLLAGTDFGVYRSTDGGATWSRYGQGMPLMAVRDLYIAPDSSFVRAGTFGRGIWELVSGAALNVAITAPASSVTLVKSATQNYTANVTNFVSNTGVNWTVAAGGGAFLPTSTTNASPTTVFTAGTTANTFLITATAAEDGTNATFATQNVTVVDPTSVNVVVSPSAPTVVSGATQVFTAAVTPITNTAVTWSISGVGSINPATGLYTAPAAPPATAQSVTVTATSTAAPTRTGTATVTVPVLTIGVTPTPVNVPMSTQQQFTATVTGSTNTSVTWSVFSGGGSVNASGLYTAPGATGSAVVRATSVADPTKFADAAVTIVTLPIVVGIAPASVSVTTSETQQFTATVTNFLSTSAVTWSVVEGAGGSVSGTGLYTAPSGTGTFHVKATSVEDTSKSATATVTVQNPVTMTITPTVAYIQPGGSATFTGHPSVGGTNYSVVGGAANGTITSGGVYTAPATQGDYQVKAQAQADNSKFALANVFVRPLVVTIDPTAATVQINTTQQFTANVTGNPNTAVNWVVFEGAAGGSVDGTGLYTAPATPGTYHVQAISVVDSSKVGLATVTVTTGAAITVSVAPAAVTVSPLGNQTFTATVTGGPSGVTWSVEEAGGGSINAGGAYTAPAALGVYHVRATSNTDPSKFGRATVTVVSPVTSFSVSPTTATILTGGTVVLTGTVNTGAINWGTTGGSLSASTGTSVTFTAPASIGTFTVTATAAADTSQTRTATINVKTKDQDASGSVDVLDLAYFARYFGTSNYAADLNGDGTVDDLDIAIFLSGF